MYAVVLLLKTKNNRENMLENVNSEFLVFLFI